MNSWQASKLLLAVRLLALSCLGIVVALAQSHESVYSGGVQAQAIIISSDLSCTGKEAVAVIQDNIEWFAPPDAPNGANVAELQAQGWTVCVIHSADLQAADLSKFRLVVIAAAQSQTYYNNLFPFGVIQHNVAQFVNDGGVLLANLADVASGPGSGGSWFNWTFVGGVRHSISFASDNNIADATHSIINNGLPCLSNNCGQILDTGPQQDLDGWNASSHGYFTNLRAATRVVLNQPDVTGDGQPEPVLIEYGFGNGVVVATLTTTEWRYVGGFASLPRNKKLLANMIAYAAAVKNKGKSTFSLIDPVKDYVVTQDYGRNRRDYDSRCQDNAVDYFHTGLDLSPKKLDKNNLPEVLAAADGRVIIPHEGGSCENHGLGKVVILEHNTGSGFIYTLYGHLSSIDVQDGDMVKQGRKIGSIGNSCTSSTHLHYEVKSQGVLQNPVGTPCGTGTCTIGTGNVCYGYTQGWPDAFGYFNPLTLTQSK